MERGTDHFRRPFELLDQLSIDGLHRHLLVLQPVAEHGDLAAVVAGEILLPIILQLLCRGIADLVRRRQHAARARAVGKEERRLILNVEALDGGEAACRQRRDAAERMKQRHHHVVDDLARRHHDLVRLDAGKIVTA